MPYRPWAPAVSFKGRLFQAWMVAFFLTTAWTVSGDVLSRIDVLGLPGSMAWIYLGELGTIGVLTLIYFFHWRPAARAADRRIQEDGAVTDDEGGIGPALASGEDRRSDASSSE